jgi:hypothetical protein
MGPDIVGDDLERRLSEGRATGLSWGVCPGVPPELRRLPYALKAGWLTIRRPARGRRMAGQRQLSKILICSILPNFIQKSLIGRS